MPLLPNNLRVQLRLGLVRDEGEGVHPPAFGRILVFGAPASSRLNAPAHQSGVIGQMRSGARANVSFPSCHDLSRLQAGAPLRAFLYPLLAILFSLSLSGLTHASSADALQHYQAGKYDTALKEYDRLRQQRPEDSRLAFNAGAAAYQSKQFEEATRHFSGATGARDPKLAQSAFYNLGNAQFQLGETAADANQKREAWESALGFYDTALKLNSADPDAKHNRDFVQHKIEELKKQQDKDKQDQKPDDKKDDQKKDDQKQDRPGEDKKPDDKKSGDQKQQKPDGSKPDQQNPPPQPDKPGEQKQPDQKQPEDQKGEQKQGQQGEQGEKDSAQAAAALGQMTPQQAMQLLDSQRAEERTLVFQPTNATQKASGRVMKNW